MREYKFRGKIKNPKVNKWVYGYLVDECHINEKNQLGYTLIRKETIGQYIGLKDKNGKEIYEGDILELNKDGRIFYGTSDGLFAKKYQLVGFKDGAFMTCRNKHLIDDYDTYLWIISKYSTVAGNIYDNPELLEEGE